MESQFAIAEQLKKIREQQGLSIRTLAQDVSVVPETIRKIELGITKSPGVKLIADLAQRLNVSITELLYEQSYNEIQNQDKSEMTIHQSHPTTIQVEIPQKLILDTQACEELKRRLAFELELIREREQGMNNTTKGREL